MSFYGAMHGYGRDGQVRQINSVRDIDLSQPRWARYNLGGNWTEMSAPDAMIQCYQNVGPNGEKVVALITESDDFDAANDRLLSFFVDAAVWFSSSKIDDVPGAGQDVIAAAPVVDALQQATQGSSKKNVVEAVNAVIDDIKPKETADDEKGSHTASAASDAGDDQSPSGQASGAGDGSS